MVSLVKICGSMPGRMWRAADEPKRAASSAARLMFFEAKAGKDSTRLCLGGAGTGGTAVSGGVDAIGYGGTCWASLDVVDGAGWWLQSLTSQHRARA